NQRLSLKKWHWLLDIGECRTSQLNSGAFTAHLSINFAGCHRLFLGIAMIPTSKLDESVAIRVLR
ncbi:hypothetical protein, partial [Vibrio vulnificus]|uniref:hypothetical protein n=1 Tax=Vibrio vulnificus TaxID=672 RepID=UPI0019D492EC